MCSLETLYKWHIKHFRLVNKIDHNSYHTIKEKVKYNNDAINGISYGDFFLIAGMFPWFIQHPTI